MRVGTFALTWAFASMLGLTLPAQADVGKTAGAFSVSPGGAATYSVPLWTPPGPRGVQPSLSLQYSSHSGNGILGVGWSLGGISSITRCNASTAQDGNVAGVSLSDGDKICLDGKRLRPMGPVPVTQFQTEIADHSIITISGNVQSSTTSWTVKTKAGWTMEYGTTPDARVIPGPAPYQVVSEWMLNKVTDRDGNTYTITYKNETGTAVPLTIAWAPVAHGSSTYRHEATFEYLPTPRTDKDSMLGSIGGWGIANRNRVESISIKSGGVTKRKYVLTYDTGPVTELSRLRSLKECSDDAVTSCLAPTALAYQQGQMGVVPGLTTGPAGSNNSTLRGDYDFNGDGRDDLAYKSGANWVVSFASAGGFTGAVSTGIPVAKNPIADRFLSGGKDAFLTENAGALWTYAWNGSSFVAASTGIAYPSYQASQPPVAADISGDGLADLAYIEVVMGSQGLPAQTGVVRTVLNASAPNAVNPAFGAPQVGISITHACLPNGACGNAGLSDLRSQMAPGLGLRHIDIDGDGTQDIYLMLSVSWSGNGTGGGGALGLLLRSNGGTLNYPPQPWDIPVEQTALHFNNDKCTDRFDGSRRIVFVSKCNNNPASEVPVPGSWNTLNLADWDSDGKTDLLVQDGSTVGVLRSTGNGFLPPLATVLPAGSYFIFDTDGDGYDDFARTDGGSAVTYWTRGAGAATYATHVPDLLTSVTDGYALGTTINYGATSLRNYTHGVTAGVLEQPFELPIVVVQSSHSDGASGSYSKTYTYHELRVDSSRNEDVGFSRVSTLDSRNGGVATDTYYEQLFPFAGDLKRVEVSHPNGTGLVSKTTYTNSQIVLNTGLHYSRTFTYRSETLSEQYEAGGPHGGHLSITSRTTLTNVDGTYGNVGTITSVVTDNDDASLTPGGEWRTVTSYQYRPADTTAWCVDLLSQTTVSTTTPGSTAVTRTTDFTPWPSGCRHQNIIVEQNSGKYRVDTALDYDAFGNVRLRTITAREPGATPSAPYVLMPQRSEDLEYDPSGVHVAWRDDAKNQRTTLDYYFDVGLLKSVTDPNNVTTTFTYDGFGRQKEEIRPDNTRTSIAYLDCAPSCKNGRHKVTVQRSELGTNLSVIKRTFEYLDQYERTLGTLVTNADATYQASEVEYNGLGQVARRGLGCGGTSPTVCRGSEEFTYDAAGRLKTRRRPADENNAGLKTTSYVYDRRRVTITDPYEKGSTKIMDASGQVRRTIDANNYSQTFSYDGANSLVGLVDSQSRTLFSATHEYGAGNFQVQKFDPAAGTRTQEFDGLGQLRRWHDPKGQTFQANFDQLGRPSSRVEPDLTTTWHWDVDTAESRQRPGALLRVESTGTSGTYAESFHYDSMGRPTLHRTSIPGDTTHDFNYAYDPTSGMLDTLTYPASTGGYRLKLQYQYNGGRVWAIRDANDTNKMYWELTALTPYGQVEGDTIGQSIRRLRLHDGVTGWLSSVQATAIAANSYVQNTAYLYDLVGNVTQRQDNQAGLTENFYYGGLTDNLYRLDYSTLNDGNNTVRNLDLDYDALGNILTKNDTSGTDATIDHSVTWTSYNYPAAITAPAIGEEASFSYGPDRQRWRMALTTNAGTSNTGSETTYYVGGLFEKVITNGVFIEFRHYIQSPAGTVSIYSRKSDGTNGTNALRHVLNDHLGSVHGVYAENGTPIGAASFTAFGNRRGAAGWTGALDQAEREALDGVTRQGFTFHSMLGATGLIHMNGRVHDAVTGRFLSPDPLVADSGYTQSWNRYSYVYNSPLTYSDPSGFTPECSVSGGDVYGTHNYFTETITARERDGTPIEGGGSRTRYDGFTVTGMFMRCNGNMTPTPGGDERGDDERHTGPTGPIAQQPKTEVPCLPGTQCSLPVVPTCLKASNIDLKRKYRDARTTAFERFHSAGRNKEESYGIYRNNSNGAFSMHFETGQDGRGNVYRPADGWSLALHGHIHNRPVGLSFQNWRPGLSFSGPSPADMNVRSNFPSVPFVLDQRVDGEWQVVCF